MLSFELTSFTLSLLYSSRIILFICPKITRFNWQSGSDLLVSPCAWKETSNSVYSFSINVSLVLTECYYIIDFIHPRSYINLSWNLHFFNNQHKSRPFVRLSVQSRRFLESDPHFPLHLFRFPVNLNSYLAPLISQATVNTFDKFPC